MQRIAALVEGHTEVHFVMSTYGNALVQRPFPNGEDVDLDLIVESIVDALEVIGGAISTVLILLDREGRDMSAGDIRQYVAEKISSACKNRTFYIGVSDRMVENWLMADEELIRGYFKVPEYKYAGDGSNGKAALKNVSGGASRGPRDTADLLARCAPSRAAPFSASLEAFVSSVDFEWAWAQA